MDGADNAGRTYQSRYRIAKLFGPQQVSILLRRKCAHRNDSVLIDGLTLVHADFRQHEGRRAGRAWWTRFPLRTRCAGRPSLALWTCWPRWTGCTIGSVRSGWTLSPCRPHRAGRTGVTLRTTRSPVHTGHTGRTLRTHWTHFARHSLVAL